MPTVGSKIRINPSDSSEIIMSVDEFRYYETQAETVPVLIEENDGLREELKQSPTNDKLMIVGLLGIVLGALFL